MSALPPNIVGSVLQTPLAQRQVGVLRETERAQDANAQRQQVSAIDEKDTTVETTDGDTQVHTESEGQGSQGRAFSDPDEQPAAPELASPAEGQHGRLLDIEA